MAGSNELAPIREACEAGLRAGYEAGAFEEQWPDFEQWHVIETRLLDEDRAIVVWANRRTHPIAIANTLIPTRGVEMRFVPDARIQELVDRVRDMIPPGDMIPLPRGGYWTFARFIPREELLGI